MRAGTAFKKTPPALDDRRATEEVSGEGTSCWDQAGLKQHRQTEDFCRRERC